MTRHERELSTDHLIRDIAHRSVVGSVISFSAQAVKVVVQLATVIILARLLAPADFGLIAMVTAFSLILELIKEFGLSAATIQTPGITHAQVSSLFWINAGLGAGITIFLLLAAPFIAGFFDQPILTPVTRCLSLAFLISGLTAQHWAILRRQMRFGTIAFIDTGAEIASFAVAMVMAAHGFGLWSLVAQRLTGPLLNLIGSWSLCRWRPSWPSRNQGVLTLFIFGASVTGANVASAFARSIDQILIGWLFGPEALGLYERASRLLMVPINNLNIPLYAVAMPTLSRLGDKPLVYRQTFLAMIEKLAMVTMPAAAFVLLSSRWIVDLLFGPGWSSAGPLVACFGIAAGFQPIALMVGLLYLTQNRAPELLRAATLDAILVLGLIAAGIHWGVVGVALSIACGTALFRMPLAFYLASRRGPVGLGDLMRAITPAGSAAVLVAGTLVAAREFAPQAPDTALLNLIIAGVLTLSSGLLALLVQPRGRRALLEIWNLPGILMKQRQAPTGI